MAPARAQAAVFEVALRDGRVWAASALSGDSVRGFEVTTDGARRHVDADDLLAVHAAVAQIVELPSCHFPEGDVVRGQIVGGDANGDHVEVLSPVLGRLVLPIDRLAAIAAAGQRDPLRLRLPEGVDEAIFLRAVIGYDLLAGALHHCGERGLAFAPDGAEAPRWFGPQDFLALRIADPAPRRRPVRAWLSTRLGDRLAVTLRRWSEAAVQVGLDAVPAGSTIVDLRPADVASLTFAAAGTFASDLEPVEVVESGFDAAVLHPWQRDRAAVGTPLVAGGRTHDKGLGVHARSRLVFRAPADATHFWTRVGLDDSSVALGVAADVDVRVLVDGKVRFEANGLRAGRPRDAGRIEVAPGQLVALEVDFGAGRDIGDRVDWLSPVFLPAAGRRP